METFFLHGLDSSSKGTKGQWFANHFPHMQLPDFEGSLQDRLLKLEKLCTAYSDILLVGSSFGGLMATCYAAGYPEKCRGLVLLAPALNFPEFEVPEEQIATPTIVIIGERDTVTPPDIVIPLAEKSFSTLEVVTHDDDHMLHSCFSELDWHHLLQR